MFCAFLLIYNPARLCEGPLPHVLRLLFSLFCALIYRPARLCEGPLPHVLRLLFSVLRPNLSSRPSVRRPIAACFAPSFLCFAPYFLVPPVCAKAHCRMFCAFFSLFCALIYRPARLCEGPLPHVFPPVFAPFFLCFAPNLSSRPSVRRPIAACFAPFFLVPPVCAKAHCRMFCALFSRPARLCEGPSPHVLRLLFSVLRLIYRPARLCDTYRCPSHRRCVQTPPSSKSALFLCLLLGIDFIC